jgi:putative ABC transport system ATP-binding protein
MTTETQPLSSTAASGHPVVARLREVDKHYDAGGAVVKALDGVDLEVRAGEILLLVGPSGCGKTTLLSVLAGILDVTAGAVEVFGQRVDRMTQAQKTLFRRGSIGFVFQQFNLLPTLTATENVAIPLLIHGRPYAEALEEAKLYLKMVGLEARSNFRPTELSGGQQQRVAIARALVSSPKLIVCDEPTASLDSETGRLIMEMFRRNALAAGRAVVVVTHDTRVFRYGDRIAEMLDGRILTVHESPKEFA